MFLCSAAGTLPVHLICDFVFHIFQEGGIGWIESTGEHEVLPNHNSELVSKIVEGVGLVHLHVEYDAVFTCT